MVSDDPAASLDNNDKREITDDPDFKHIMDELEVLRDQPLFNENDKEEEDDDDLFDDDYYEDDKDNSNSKASKDKEKVDRNDDYDDYSYEDGYSKPAKPKQDTNIMQDFLNNYKGKTASHRFKSKLDDLNDDSDEIIGSSSSSRNKYRKNDSIKIISTPNGKVGIVYQSQPKVEEDKTKLLKNESNTVATQVQQKIQPVLTADGKVALLYRGASTNQETFKNKYEPLQNKTILTQLIDNNVNNSSINHNNITNINNSIYNNSLNNVILEITTTTESDLVDNEDDYSEYDLPNNNNQNNKQIITSTITSTRMNFVKDVQGVHANELPVSTTMTPTSHTTLSSTLTTTTQKQQENLLLINRPLSEVLGIKNRIPNIETSTNRMKVENHNNLLSSLLNNNNNNHRHNMRNRNYDYESEDSLYNSNNNNAPRPTLSNNVLDNVDVESNSKSMTTLYDDIDDDNNVPEVINLAIIPAFEHEIEEKYLRPNYDNRYRNMAYLPTIHCAMQVMVGVAAIGTFFGVLGAYFKTRILDQIRQLGL